MTWSIWLFTVKVSLIRYSATKLTLEIHVGNVCHVTIHFSSMVEFQQIHLPLSSPLNIKIISVTMLTRYGCVDKLYKIILLIFHSISLHFREWCETTPPTPQKNKSLFRIPGMANWHYLEFLFRLNHPGWRLWLKMPIVPTKIIYRSEKYLPLVTTSKKNPLSDNMFTLNWGCDRTVSKTLQMS